MTVASKLVWEGILSDDSRFVLSGSILSELQLEINKQIAIINEQAWRLLIPDKLNDMPESFNCFKIIDNC